jgi:CBS domain-containing protein
MLRPSPAIIVPADLSIAECLNKMRDHGVGSILVVRASLPHDLIGIFTERDLLKRIEEIRKANSWADPIAVVMYKPVVTLSLFEIEKAAEVMLEKHVRHLPILYNDSSGEEHLAGVISMRDILKTWHEERTSSERPNPRSDQSLGAGARPTKKVALISGEPGLLQSTRHLLSQGGKVGMQDFDPTALLTEPALPESFKDLKLIVLDLDRLSATAWSTLLRRILHESGLPPVVVLYNPVLQEKKNVTVLHEISDGKHVSVFSKPVVLLQFLHVVQNYLA